MSLDLFNILFLLLTVFLKLEIASVYHLLIKSYININIVLNS